MTRAQSDSATADLAHLRKLVEEHGGNRSAIARALSDKRAGTSITRQGVTARLRKYGLLERADNLRVGANAPGPRIHVTERVIGAERKKILNALARSPNYDAAVPLLDMSVATMYRKIRDHGITPDEVAARRAALARKAPRRSSKRRAAR